MLVRETENICDENLIGLCLINYKWILQDHGTLEPHGRSIWEVGESLKTSLLEIKLGNRILGRYKSIGDWKVCIVFQG